MITHFGTVAFAENRYRRSSGSLNWQVEPVGGLPLGQVKIAFRDPARSAYSVLVTARRLASTPLLGANFGSQDENGFVVHLWETVADRTVANGDFSFLVLTE
jgi:hypothetical protein